MPTEYVGSVKAIPALPENKEQRIAKLLEIHTRLTWMYGERYQEIRKILTDARKWEKDKNQSVLTNENIVNIDTYKKNIVATVSQLRTDIVLFFKMAISRAEFLVNELMPGTFDVNPPTQSLDWNDISGLGAAIAAFGSALMGLGVPFGAAIAAIGGLIGAAAYLCEWLIG